MNKEFFHLKNVGSEHIGDVLLKIQRSFNIKFDSNDLGYIVTFGDLCDVIQNKINLEQEDSCTTQHAFYLLRNAIAATTGTDKCYITPHSRLAKLFPRESRLEAIADIEQELGFKINLIQPKQWVIAIFSFTLVASFIAFFYNWPTALGIFLASVIGLKLAGKFGKEIRLKTVGDLANKISRESYVKARRNPAVNRSEIEQKVTELFTDELTLKPAMVTRQTTFR
ncbi:MAG TPA: hypothetical protein VHE59_03490 [Mucilaginibacter sp.]|nr:hypothetical protein [Mucilaginibacter sp.]